MNEKVLSEFREKFNPFVDDDEDSLEPGELKSPVPSESSKPSPVPSGLVKSSPATTTEKMKSKPSAPPFRAPSPLLSLTNRNLGIGIKTLPIDGSCTEKYESRYHGLQTIYKMAPALPVPVIIPAAPAESETTPFKKKTDSDTKSSSSNAMKTERRARSKSRESRRRRSGSVIRGSGGFIRKGKFRLMDSYRGGRGRNRGRGGINRHPRSRFRPATAEDRERGREEKKRRKHEIKSKDIKELPNVKWTKATPSISYSFNLDSIEKTTPVVPPVQPEIKKDENVEKKEEPLKKEEPSKKEKKVKKEKKAKKSKEKIHIKKSKVKKAPKELDTTPSCTPPHNIQNPCPTISPPNVVKSPSIQQDEPPLGVNEDPEKLKVVDYEDDDDEDIVAMEIQETFPLAKDPDSWENEEDVSSPALIEQNESFKDGFSTPIFVNPSPPADHKFDDIACTQEIVTDSVTPPISSTMYKRQESDDSEPETKIFNSSKQLFGIDDLYSDVLNSINRSAVKRPLTPSSSSPSSSSSEEKLEERTTTPPLELINNSENENIEPENTYANFSEEDLAKIQKLDENLAKIQSMRSNYGDPADEFCEGLNKMEKFLTTARNITIQKYSSTPQFLVTLQEAEIKEDQSPPVFQSSIKMVITPSHNSKNRVATNLLGSDEDDDEVAPAEKEEEKKEEQKKVVDEKVVTVVEKEEKKVAVPEVKKDRKPTRSPEKKDKDRRSYKMISESPNKRKRSRSPKVLDKGHRRDRHVDDRHKRRSRSRSMSPRRHSSPSRRSRHRRARSRSRSFSPRSKRRRSRSRSRGFSRSPLPFKPPSPPPLPVSSHSPSPPQPPPHSAIGVPGTFYPAPVPVIAPYNDANVAYNAYGHYGYMTMPVQNVYPNYFAEPQSVDFISPNNVNVCDFGLQSHLNQNPSVIKELPKAITPPKPDVAVQKGNVLEIVPKEFVSIKIKEERIESVEVEKAKIKVTSLSAKRKEVEFRYLNTAVLRLKKENDDVQQGILKARTSSCSDEELTKQVIKTKKKTVLFEDGIKPNEDSEEEDRRDIEEKIQRKLKRLKKKFSQIDKENQEQQVKRTASDDEWDKMSPPPAPPGSPPPHLDQPVYLRPDSPPTFTYFLYDSHVNALYTAGNENALPPRLLYDKSNPQSCLPSPAATPPIGSTPPPPIQKSTNGKPLAGSFSPNLSQPPPNFFVKLEANASNSSPLAFAGTPPLPFVGSPHNMQKNPKFPNTPPMHTQFFPRMQFPPHLQPPPFTKPQQMNLPPGAIPVPFGPIPMGMPPFCGFSQPPPPQDMMFQPQIRHFPPNMTAYPIPPGPMNIQPPPHLLPMTKKKSRFNN